MKKDIFRIALLQEIKRNKLFFISNTNWIREQIDNIHIIINYFKINSR
jgi:hypothetical protein